MKKALLLLALVCLPLFASAQTTEKQYYIYNIVIRHLDYYSTGKDTIKREQNKGLASIFLKG